MRRLPLLLLFAVLTLAACRTEAPEVPDAAAGYEAHGAALTPEGAMPVQAVVADLARYDGQRVKLEGTVAEVCQQAGCWLTLQTDRAPGVRIRVARDDDGQYVFTVPTDISGRRVVVEGTLTAETLSAELQQHLDEDAGRPADSLYVPQDELQLTADGVLIETI